MILKTRLLFIALLTIVGASILLGQRAPVKAQFAENERERQLEAAGGPRGAGLTAQDPRFVMGQIIQVILSVGGTVMFCFMFYAGFIWFTAGGDDEKVNHAKKVIKNSTIGLFVILISLSLTTYILSRATWATGNNITHVVAYNNTGLSTSSPVVIIVRIVQVLLALVGLILFCFMFYSGFTWFTAAGDTEKVNHAKDVIKTTVVGLLVILIAYSLTAFILSRVVYVSGGGVGGSAGFSAWVFF